MKRTQKILMATLLVSVAIALLIVLLFESDVVMPGALDGRPQLEFVVLSAAELLVICAIPLALRLFKFQTVRRQLLASPSAKLLFWGMLRLLMLCVPLVLCTLCYYLFSMKAAFGYLAIILLLCLGFVIPTMEKCKAETSAD